MKEPEEFEKRWLKFVLPFWCVAGLVRYGVGFLAAGLRNLEHKQERRDSTEGFHSAVSLS